MDTCNYCTDRNIIIAQTDMQLLHRQICNYCTDKYIIIAHIGTFVCDYCVDIYVIITQASM